jgi:shikimate kinase
MMGSGKTSVGRILSERSEDPGSIPDTAIAY